MTKRRRADADVDARKKRTDRAVPQLLQYGAVLVCVLAALWSASTAAPLVEPAAIPTPRRPALPISQVKSMANQLAYHGDADRLRDLLRDVEFKLPADEQQRTAMHYALAGMSALGPALDQLDTLTGAAGMHQTAESAGSQAGHLRVLQILLNKVDLALFCPLVGSCLCPVYCCPLVGQLTVAHIH